jgi:hypothetical protein
MIENHSVDELRKNAHEIIGYYFKRKAASYLSYQTN